MLLHNSFSISEGKPNLPFLCCHLSYSTRFLKVTIYTVYCLLDRQYNIKRMVYSIYFIVYIYSILREYLFFANFRYIDFFSFSQKLISKFKVVNDLKVAIMCKDRKPQAINILSFNVEGLKPK